MRKLRDRPVTGVLQRTLEEPPGVKDVRFDQAPYVGIPSDERLPDRSMLLEVGGVQRGASAESRKLRSPSCPSGHDHRCRFVIASRLKSCWTRG